MGVCTLSVMEKGAEPKQPPPFHIMQPEILGSCQHRNIYENNPEVGVSSGPLVADFVSFCEIRKARHQNRFRWTFETVKCRLPICGRSLDYVFKKNPPTSENLNIFLGYIIQTKIRAGIRYSAGHENTNQVESMW